jgi:hypothetical protein
MLIRPNPHPRFEQQCRLPMDIDDIGVPSNHGFDPEFAAATDWARLYRSAGVQIVPCKNKHPVLKTWREYQNELVPQLQFDRWYGHGGEFAQSYDMGMLTGQASGRVLMIDLDIYKGPEAGQWWNKINEIHNNGLELETVEQKTGGGGRQLFYVYPKGWNGPGNIQTSLNIDIKEQGGFAVLPPTLHSSGNRYEWRDGYAPWDMEMEEAPPWLLEAVTELCQVYGHAKPGGYKPVQGAPPDAHYNAFGRLLDGRENYMSRVVYAAAIDFYRDCNGVIPSEAESRLRCAEKYLIYEDHVESRLYDPSLSRGELLDMERPNQRGAAEFWKKWNSTLKNWHGKIAEEARKPGKEKNSHSREGFSPSPAGDIFPYLDVDQIMDKPDPVWVVDGVINERALGFIFGPPSSLKTFIALDLALSMAARLPQWWSRGISRHGAVVYLCREGTSSFKKRIQAWEIHRKCQARGIPFYLIEHPCNFMDGGDVGKAVATIKAIMAKAGVPVAAVMVDTVSRVLPGAEENLQKDMTLFVRACELIQLEFQCIVIGVHHTNKNGAIRGSTVLPGAGDFLLETKRETGQTTGTMVLQKVKDGEDGIEMPFKFTKIDLPGITPRTSLVVDPEGDARPVSAAGAAGVGDLPDIAVCREILAAIALAWFQKMPWCKSANGARPAVDMIAGRWQLKRDVVKQLLALWLANGVIENEVYDKRNKLSGYRKIIDL